MVDDSIRMSMWVAELRGLAPTDLFRCDCRGRVRLSPKRRCDYHKANWPLILQVAIDEFRTAFGSTSVELDEAIEIVVPQIEDRLKHRRHRRELGFAISMFAHPMLVDSDQWTNGQHRCQAAIDAGCTHVLFVD